MTDQPRKRTSRQASVVARAQLSPHLVRLTLHCPALTGEPVLEACSDVYVKVEVRDESEALVRRSYTVRNWDAESATFHLDVVIHGEGPGGRWASQVQIGDQVTFLGPGGGYSPAADAQIAHLLAGDLSALPAIEESLTRIPADHRGLVVVAVDDSADVRELATHLPVEWVVRDTLPQALEDARKLIEAWTCEGDLEVFIHGEAEQVRSLRRHVRVDRQVPPERQSVSGYWSRGLTDEEWRRSKVEWKQPMDAAEAAAIAG